MVVVAIALINVPRYIRLMRSEILSLRESRFIEAAIATGASTSRVNFKHLLPNVWGIVLVQTSLTIANAIVVIASLSFLGVGVSAPTPSWGGMIRDGANGADGEIPEHVREILDFLSGRTRAEIDWARSFLKRLRDGEYAAAIPG